MGRPHRAPLMCPLPIERPTLLTEIPGAGDDRIMIAIGPIAVKGRKPITIRVPRFDFLDPDTYDALIKDLEDLDAEAQVVAVANDLADTPVGEPVFWEPLMKPARITLQNLGVVVKRNKFGDVVREEISCPTDEVLEALRPYSDQPVLTLPKRARSVVLSMLKHVLTPSQLEACGLMTVGQLNAIRDEWHAKSQVSLGEFLASSSS